VHDLKIIFDLEKSNRQPIDTAFDIVKHLQAETK
jgi:hypothetical protein